MRRDQAKARRTQAKSAERSRIYCDGSGARPDGSGSGFAWLNEVTGEKHIERKDGLTNNEAEYWGLLSALNALSVGTTAEIFTDSLLMSSQLNDRFRVLNPKLIKLLDEVRSVVERKKLEVTISWIPRAHNPAGKLL
jgi:ribonuclease HI